MVKCPIVPPSATTNGPFSFSFFTPLSSHPSLFCLKPPPMSLAVFIFLHHPSPPPPLLSSLLPLFPISPLLSLPLYPQLISFSCLICCPFQFNFFPTLPPPKCAHACLHTYTSPSFHSYISFSRLSLCLSGVGSALPSPPERVLSLLCVKLTSWGHVDLFYPFPGITSHLLTNISDAKSLSCSSL